MNRAGLLSPSEELHEELLRWMLRFSANNDSQFISRIWECPSHNYYGFDYLGLVPNGTLRVHLRSYGLTMAAACARPLSPRVPFLILAFRRVSERPPLRPLCALDPHFCRAHTWASLQQTSTRQSKRHYVTNCGLRGRPRGFRVTFGTGPWNTRQESHRPHLRSFCGAPPF